VLTYSLSYSILYQLFTLLSLLLADVEKFFCSALPLLVITLLIVPVVDIDILLKTCVLRRIVLRRLSYYLYTTPFCGNVRLAYLFMIYCSDIHIIHVR